MQADALCIAVLQSVVELLVVAEVETLLLEFPLQIPVGLGNKEKAGMLFLMAEMISTQYSVVGRGPARLPQVRSKN